MKLTNAIVVASVMLLAAGCSQAPQTATYTSSLKTATHKSPWDASAAGGVKITTSHYDLYSTVRNRTLLSTMPGFMEAAYRNYLRLLDLPDAPLERRMPIYLLATRSEWVALTRQIFGPHAKAENIEAGGYMYQGVGVFWNIGPLPTLSVASHEGLHQFLHYRLRDQLPMWLEEGLCVTAEGYLLNNGTVTFTPGRNLARFNDLRSAMVNSHWIPLGRLLSMDAGDAVGNATERAVGYYGQLWALAGFIRSRDAYCTGLQRLLRDAEAGRLSRAMGIDRAQFARLRNTPRAYNRELSEPIFRHYIASDLEAFERQYRAYAEKVTSLR